MALPGLLIPGYFGPKQFTHFHLSHPHMGPALTSNKFIKMKKLPKPKVKRDHEKPCIELLPNSFLSAQRARRARKKRPKLPSCSTTNSPSSFSWSWTWRLSPPLSGWPHVTTLPEEVSAAKAHEADEICLQCWTNRSLTGGLNPNDPCFDWKLDLLLEAKQRTNGFQVWI